jgi:hypothetical protein
LIGSHFEAGSLAKIVDRSKVVPILFNLEPSNVQGPLTQFQMANFNKDEMRRLLKSINNSGGDSKIADIRLGKAFEAFWPQLNDENQKVDFGPKSVSQPSEAGNVENSLKPILEEILVTTRNLSIKTDIFDKSNELLIDHFKRTQQHTEVYLAATAEKLAERIERTVHRSFWETSAPRVSKTDMMALNDKWVSYRLLWQSIVHFPKVTPVEINTKQLKALNSALRAFDAHLLRLVERI